MRLRPSVVALVLLALAVGCSSDEGTSSSEPLPTVSVVETSGDACTDPVGDLSTAARVSGTLTEPSGVDLTGVEAVLDEAALTVTFETVGDPTTATGPVFTVFQGPPAELGSWEIQLELGDEGWTGELTTYHPRDRLLTEGRRQPLLASVVVEGTTTTATIPADALPPTATLLWGFGASATGADGDTVIDDCDTLGDQVVPDTSG